MKIHTETVTRFNIAENTSEELTVRFTQPWYNRLMYKAYHWYDMHIFKVPGFKKVEDLDEWLHRLRCNDNCMTGEVARRGDDGKMHSKTETYCAHLPLAARQDCRCFDFSRKNRKEVLED